MHATPDQPSHRSTRPFALLLSLVVSLFAAGSFASGDSHSSRFILELDAPIDQHEIDVVLGKINQQTQLTATLIRTMSGDALVVGIEHDGLTDQSIAQQLTNMPDIQSVSADAVVRVTATVDDPRFAEQWQLHTPDVFAASLDATRAWDITHGSPEVVVAVVDTGIDYNHPDLAGRLLPGYDFVSRLSLSVDKGVSVAPELEFIRSHDGDGRDNDASDPGDAIDEHLRAQFESVDIECYVNNSSWHGTAMASIIAANPNDGIGVAGIDWHAKILPVRAIGKCGGRRSDMLDAIRWAAGVNDPALPPNPTPARIINLSLGVDDLCTTADQQAINEAIAAGAIVVAAVGNNGRNTDVQPSSPSHCQNVIGVMAIDKHGYRASYSNVGRDADVAAPGGDLSPSIERVLVATNKGVDTPSSEFGYRPATGTSVASPHVAAVLALMLSVKPDLSNRELEALMLDSTRAFPKSTAPLNDTDVSCEPSLCGAGILDAFAAVQAVETHIPGTFLDSPSLAAAQSVPVTVGAFTGFGCTVSARNSDDPVALLLCMIAALMLFRRRQTL